MELRKLKTPLPHMGTLKTRKNMKKKGRKSPSTFRQSCTCHQFHFPGDLGKAKFDKQVGGFLEVLQKLYINIPFIEGLQQMLPYAKFLKDILSNKRRLEEYEIVEVTKEYSDSIQTSYLQNSRTQDASPFLA